MPQEWIKEDEWSTAEPAQTEVHTNTHTHTHTPIYIYIYIYIYITKKTTERLTNEIHQALISSRKGIPLHLQKLR